MRLFLASAPNMSLSAPNFSSHAKTNSGASTAILPKLTCAAPQSKAVCKSVADLIPPPKSTVSDVLVAMASSTLVLTICFARAPSKSTT